MPSLCAAVPQYRCDGRIQYRPCDQIVVEKKLPGAGDAPRSEGPRAVHNSLWRIKGERYAEVVKSSFSKVGSNHGEWRGVIRGNGLVETELRIFRNNSLEARWYMGHVWLADKQTPFTFKSMVPPGKGWDWQVFAWAR